MYSLDLAGFGSIAACFLLEEHRAHFLCALPLLLLAGPLMHLMHGHGYRGYGKHPQTPGHTYNDKEGVVPWT